MKIPDIFPKKNKELDLESLFIILASGVVLVGWLTLVLTIAQLFFKFLIIIGISFIAISIFSYLKSYRSIQSPTKTALLVFLFVVFFAVFNGFFAHETFEGGRDQGIYANSAVYLSKNHSLKITEKIELPGFVLAPDKKAHIPQFHFSYISYLALHHVFLGILGIKLANFLPLIIGLFSLFLIGKKIAGTKAGLFTVLMLATSFILIWYSRRTFSEIYSMALIWFAILTFLKSYLENKTKFLMITVASFGLLLFTRIEGVMIFGMFLGTILLLYLFAKKRRRQFISILIPTAMVLLLFVFYSLKIQPSYNNQILSTYKKPLGLISGLPKTIRPTEEFVQSFDYVSDRPTLYIFQVLQAYNLLIPLGLGFIVVFWSILQTGHHILKSVIFRIFRHRRVHFDFSQPTTLLIIFILISPTFFELINITTYHDQPWMLRRFLPTIIPFACLFSSIFLVKFVKAARYLLLFFILGVNLIISAPILTFAEFDNVLQNEIKEIAQALPNGANVFYERQSSGRFNIDLPLRFVFDKKNIAFKDATEIVEFISQSNTANVYIILQANKATDSFLPEGATELIMEKIIRYKELERVGTQQFPSEFITRHTFYGKTPRKIKDTSIPLKIVKIKEDFKNSLPDDVLLYRQTDWSFTEGGFLLKRGSTGNIRYKGIKPKRLQLIYSGNRPKVSAVLQGRKEKLENITYYDDLLTIDLEEINLNKWYGYYSFDVFSQKSDLLIKEIRFD